MFFSGRAHKVGAHIDTDAIIPARYLTTTNSRELGQYCLHGLEPGWTENIQRGDILAAGPNFGCGSSREHAPLAILGAGIPVVIAHSFARIFYRNGFNMGLVLLEVGENIEKIASQDELEVYVEEGTILNKSKGLQIEVPPLPEFMQEILHTGGLIEYVKQRLDARS